MNKAQAIQLVKETLESPFERSRYIRFLKNLLNTYDDEGARSNQGGRIPEKFQDYVEKMERVGKYAVDKQQIMLFIVYLKKETSIERARTMQRNFVAWYLTRDTKDAALVAFVSPHTDDWRFSLVKMDYRFEEKDGQTRVKEEFTPARRWSFLVGVNEKSHTAQSKLVPIIEDDKNKPTLAEIEDAFNIEQVTKEFFEKYRDLFMRAKDALDKAVAANPKAQADFANKGIDTVNLAKKLLGQIIFLYYLQKKGWFGVPRDGAWGEGSKNFLRDLFAQKRVDENFFNDILEHLFYDALRNDRSHDDHYYGRFNCKIPFLNGGLFDPLNNYDWIRADILLPDSLFSNQNKTKEGDTGDGILDIFDRYNFTVKEDEPFEKEVAIDPELLGKAYEKFNAIRPDNYDEFLKALKSGKKGDESKFNKQYGVYYTPREIVHYMCQQSLINYLASELVGGDGRPPLPDAPTKDDLALLIQHGESWREHEARVDAAGRETDTYSYKLPETIRRNAALIDAKLAAIKVCDPAVGSGAFPVGMMSEIVRAREVLAIFTPLSSPLQGGQRGVYDFKRECIENSLYGVDIDPGAVEIAKLRLWLSLIVDEDDIHNIKPLPNLDYKIVCGNSLVGFPDDWSSPIEKEIEALIHRHFNETHPTQKDRLKTQIDEKIEGRYQNSLRTFGYQVNFDFRTVFSEVFQQNGGFDVVIANPPYGVDYSDDEKKILKNIFRYKSGKPESYIFFIEKSLTVLKPGAVLDFIIPNAWLTNYYGQQLRRYLLTQSRINQIVNLEPMKVFSDAIVDTVILVTQKVRSSTTNSVLILEATSDGRIVEKHLVPQSNWESDEEMIFNIMTSHTEASVIEKFSSISIPLSEICEYSQGIIPYKTKEEGAKNLYISSKAKNSEWKPLLEGGDCIGKYSLTWHNQYIHYGSWLWCQRDSKYFEEPKLLFHRIRKKLPIQLVATYDEQRYYNRHSLSNLIKLSDSPYHLKYILGLFNSKLLNYWFIKKFGLLMEVGGFKVGQLPIRFINFSLSHDKKLHDEIVSLVDCILAARRANPQADTSAPVLSEVEGWEREIDKIVYELYGLTEEEVKIVEG